MIRHCSLIDVHHLTHAPGARCHMSLFSGLEVVESLPTLVDEEDLLFGGEATVLLTFLSPVFEMYRCILWQQ